VVRKKFQESQANEVKRAKHPRYIPLKAKGGDKATKAKAQ
jgi:hypothetical protein